MRLMHPPLTVCRPGTSCGFLWQNWSRVNPWNHCTGEGDGGKQGGEPLSLLYLTTTRVGLTWFSNSGNFVFHRVRALPHPVEGMPPCPCLVGVRRVPRRNLSLMLAPRLAVRVAAPAARPERRAPGTPSRSGPWCPRVRAVCTLVYAPGAAAARDPPRMKDESPQETRGGWEATGKGAAPQEGPLPGSRNAAPLCGL